MSKRTSNLAVFTLFYGLVLYKPQKLEEYYYAWQRSNNNNNIPSVIPPHVESEEGRVYTDFTLLLGDGEVVSKGKTTSLNYIYSLLFH